MLFKNSGKIMYNCLTGNSILYKKQFDFHGGHSFEHAIVQVVDQIRNSFESNQYTFFVIIAFEVVAGNSAYYEGNTCTRQSMC